MATVGISFRIDEDVLKRVDEVADYCEQSRSEVITRVLRNNIDEEEQFQKKLRDPVFREIAKLVLKPAFALTLAKLAGDELTPEMLKQAQAALERASSKPERVKGKKVEG